MKYIICLLLLSSLSTHSLGQYDPATKTGFLEKNSSGKTVYEFVKNDTVLYSNLIKTSDAYCLGGNCISGKGKLVLTDGSLYEGDVENGKAEGTGTITYLNGMVYTGMVHNNMMHGKGKRTFRGEYYQGNYADNKKNGYGEYYWSPEKFYKGEWKDNVKEGRGIYNNGSGEVYEGSVSNDIYMEEGILKLANGDRYTSKEWIGPGFNYGSYIPNGRSAGIAGIYHKNKFTELKEAEKLAEQGFDKNMERRIKDCMKAINKGNKDSIPWLGALYVGLDGLRHKGMELLRIGDANGNLDCTYELGELYGYRGYKLLDSALAYYNKAASAGFVPAMYQAGQIYERGNLKDSTGNLTCYYNGSINMEKATYWYKIAADKHDAKSIVIIQNFADKAAGSPFATAAKYYLEQNYSEAMKWCITSIDKTNDARAMLIIAVMYDFGWGVDKDRNIAKTWFERAGDGGNGEAYNFAANIWHSQGAHQKAYELWEKSIKLGFTKSIDELDNARNKDRQESFNTWAQNEIERKAALGNSGNSSSKTNNSRTCPMCHGSGVLSNNVGQPTLTQDKSGKWYNTYGAKNSTCNFCNGKGYL